MCSLEGTINLILLYDETLLPLSGPELFIILINIIIISINFIKACQLRDKAPLSKINNNTK